MTTAATNSAASPSLVSVVVIAYNCAQHVGHAIQSVLEQTWTNLELIVVDDGSTDSTGEVIQRISDPRITYVRQTNKGPNAARNEGIRHARGEFIAFLDCDDWWLPVKLEKQLARVTAEPEIGLVYSLAIRVDASGREGDRFDSIVEGRVLDRLLLGNCIAGSASSAMVTRRAIDAVGTFDESLHYAEDWEYWIRIASRFSVACVPDFDVYLLDRPGSQGKNAQATRRDSLRFIHTALDRYAPSRPLFRRAALARLHYVASYNLWAAGLIWDARKELLRSLVYNPLHLTYYKRMVRLFFPKRQKLSSSEKA
jgi:glycosyltransferase involved in cell wall biosynthesis